MEVVEPGWRSHFAEVLKVTRYSLYARPSEQDDKDIEAISELLTLNSEHEFYGVVRIALETGWSENKARRIRTLAGVVASTRKKKNKSSGVGVKAEIPTPSNALKPYADFKNETRPQDGQSYARMTEAEAWVQDFTHIWFMGRWVYVATVLDLKTRQIVGWSMSLTHDKGLVHAAILDALSKHPAPRILHSDQGSEYLSQLLQDLCKKMEIVLSCSDRGSPWQNGFQERFYGTLKDELGPTTRFKDLAELLEGVALTIYYYNHKRIHTALKMSPAAYAATLILQK